jgi:hypothetical protein
MYNDVFLYDYEQALKLKELGFNEECLAWSDGKSIFFNEKSKYNLTLHKLTGRFKNAVLMPTFEQAFDWLEKEFNFFVTINLDQTMEPKFCYSVNKYNLDSKGNFGWKIITYNSDLFYTKKEAKTNCLDELLKLASDELNEIKNVAEYIKEKSEHRGWEHAEYFAADKYGEELTLKAIAYLDRNDESSQNI